MVVPRLPGAYYLRHLPTGKYYIGSSGSLYFRLSVHKSTLLKGKHTNKNLQELFTRWEDFSFEMHICDTREEAYDKEQSMLDSHAGDPLMCNIGTLARGNYESNGAVKAAVAKMKSSPPTHWVGRKHTDETRAKMKISRATSTGGHTEKSKAELSERMKGNTVWAGRTHTEEAKLKTAMAKWKPVSIEGTVYPSIGHAATALGISPAACGGRVKKKGLKWSEWKFA